MDTNDDTTLVKVALPKGGLLLHSQRLLRFLPMLSMAIKLGAVPQAIETLHAMRKELAETNMSADEAAGTLAALLQVADASGETPLLQAGPRVGSHGREGGRCVRCAPWGTAEMETGSWQVNGRAGLGGSSKTRSGHTSTLPASRSMTELATAASQCNSVLAGWWRSYWRQARTRPSRGCSRLSTAHYTSQHSRYRPCVAAKDIGYTQCPWISWGGAACVA